MTKTQLDGGGLVYTPPPDANGTGYASVAFKVGDGTDESALAYTIALDVTAVNDPATGLPTISGTARVGQTLTADASAIADAADGLPAPASFLYQWLRVSGANETPILNADARTYRLEAADAGAKFKVRVSFTDLDGHPEARTSDAWPATTVAANAAPTAAAKTVTLAEDGSHPFSEADFGYQDSDGDALASVRITGLPAQGKGSLTLNGNAVQANGTVTKTQLDGGGLVYTPPPDANGTGYASVAFKVSDGTTESPAYTIALDVTAVNDPATGLPTISGTARVGQTLTADASAIRDDADGLPQASSFLYQWLRVTGAGQSATETPIQDAAARTYRLEAADAGAKFKVRVSFTDLDGHPEARTSDAWPATTVAANAAPTAAAKTVTLDEDTTHTFSAADFGFRDADPGDALASLRITVLPAAGSLTLDGNGVQANGTVTKTQLDAGDLVYTPPADANGAGYASVAFKVSDGTTESPAYTITLDVTAVNDPATGLPTISGTARVGQTLTADASAIRDDADGLPQASNFLYQWLRVTGAGQSATETPIQDAAARTYRLEAADAGAKFKVRVSFTDLDGHPEARTSDAWPEQQTVLVNAAPTGAAKTVTLDEDTAHTFSAADFGFRDADPGDALASVRITALPAQGADAGAKFKVRVSFTAHPRRECRDRQPGDRGRAAGPARVHPAGRRQRVGLRQLHVQGQRRH